MHGYWHPAHEHIEACTMQICPSCPQEPAGLHSLVWGVRRPQRHICSRVSTCPFSSFFLQIQRTASWQGRAEFQFREGPKHEEGGSGEGKQLFQFKHALKRLHVGKPLTHVCLHVRNLRFSQDFFKYNVPPAGRGGQSSSSGRRCHRSPGGPGRLRGSFARRTLSRGWGGPRGRGVLWGWGGTETLHAAQLS